MSKATKKITKKPASKVVKPAAKVVKSAAKVVKKAAAKSIKKPAVVSTVVVKPKNSKLKSSKAAVATKVKQVSAKVKSDNDCSMDKSSCQTNCTKHCGCRFLECLGFLRLSPRMNRQKFLVLHIFWGVIYTLFLFSLFGFNFDTDISTQANDLMMSNDYTLYQTLVLCIAFPLLFINNVFMAIRRLNDINLKGWWVMIGLIPVAGLIGYLALYFIPGTRGKNRFGNDPLKA